MRAATPRQGRQRSAIASSSPRVGPRLQPERELGRLLQGEIAGGEGVGMAEAEQQEDIGGPGADAADRHQRAMRLGGVEGAERARDRAPRARPPAPAREGRASSASTGRSRAEVVLAGEQVVRLQRRHAAISSRPKIALALATETCCETMIAASPAKPGSRRRSGGGPPISISRATISGSSASRFRAASASVRLAIDQRAGMVAHRRGRRLRPGARRFARRGLAGLRRLFRRRAVSSSSPRFACRGGLFGDPLAGAALFRNIRRQVRFLRSWPHLARFRPAAPARLSLCADAERPAASRSRLFGPVQRAFRARGGRRAAAAHRGRRPDPLQARNTRRRSSKTWPGSASPSRPTPRRQSDHLDDYARALDASARRRASSIPASARAAEIAAGERGRARSRRRAAASRTLPGRRPTGNAQRAWRRANPPRFGWTSRARPRSRPRGLTGANSAKATRSG